MAKFELEYIYLDSPWQVEDLRRAFDLIFEEMGKYEKKEKIKN